jgi:hypothetical protein
MKDMIRIGLLALVGLALIITLILALLPKRDVPTGGPFVPGTYSVNIILNNKPVELLLTVSENEIEDISLSEMEVATEVFYPLFRPTMEVLAAEIIRSQSTDEVALDMQNMYTQRVLLDAVEAALGKALRIEN